MLSVKVSFTSCRAREYRKIARNLAGHWRASEVEAKTTRNLKNLVLSDRRHIMMGECEPGVI